MLKHLHEMLQTLLKEASKAKFKHKKTKGNSFVIAGRNTTVPPESLASAGNEKHKFENSDVLKLKKTYNFLKKKFVNPHLDLIPTTAAFLEQIKLLDPKKQQAILKSLVPNSFFEKKELKKLPNPYNSKIVPYESKGYSSKQRFPEQLAIGWSGQITAKYLNPEVERADNPPDLATAFFEYPEIEESKKRSKKAIFNTKKISMKKIKKKVFGKSEKNASKQITNTTLINEIQKANVKKLLKLNAKQRESQLEQQIARAQINNLKYAIPSHINKEINTQSKEGRNELQNEEILIHKCNNSTSKLDENREQLQNDNPEYLIDMSKKSNSNQTSLNESNMASDFGPTGHEVQELFERESSKKDSNNRTLNNFSQKPNYEPKLNEILIKSEGNPKLNKTSCKTEFYESLSSNNKNSFSNQVLKSNDTCHGVSNQQGDCLHNLRDNAIKNDDTGRGQANALVSVNNVLTVENKNEFGRSHNNSASKLVNQKIYFEDLKYHNNNKENSLEEFQVKKCSSGRAATVCTKSDSKRFQGKLKDENLIERALSQCSHLKVPPLSEVKPKKLQTLDKKTTEQLSIFVKENPFKEFNIPHISTIKPNKGDRKELISKRPQSSNKFETSLVVLNSCRENANTNNTYKQPSSSMIKQNKDILIKNKTKLSVNGKNQINKNQLNKNKSSDAIITEIPQSTKKLNQNEQLNQHLVNKRKEELLKCYDSKPAISGIIETSHEKSPKTGRENKILEDKKSNSFGTRVLDLKTAKHFKQNKIILIESKDLSNKQRPKTALSKTKANTQKCKSGLKNLESQPKISFSDSNIVGKAKANIVNNYKNQAYSASFNKKEITLHLLKNKKMLKNTKIIKENCETNILNERKIGYSRLSKTKGDDISKGKSKPDNIISRSRPVKKMSSPKGEKVHIDQSSSKTRKLHSKKAVTKNINLRLYGKARKPSSISDIRSLKSVQIISNKNKNEPFLQKPLMKKYKNDLTSHHLNKVIHPSKIQTRTFSTFENKTNVILNYMCKRFLTNFTYQNEKKSTGKKVIPSKEVLTKIAPPSTPKNTIVGSYQNRAGGFNENSIRKFDKNEASTKKDFKQKNAKMDKKRDYSLEVLYKRNEEIKRSIMNQHLEKGINSKGSSSLSVKNTLNGCLKKKLQDKDNLSFEGTQINGKSDPITFYPKEKDASDSLLSLQRLENMSSHIQHDSNVPEVLYQYQNIFRPVSSNSMRWKSKTDRLNYSKQKYLVKWNKKALLPNPKKRTSIKVLTSTTSNGNEDIKKILTINSSKSNMNFFQKETDKAVKVGNNSLKNETKKSSVQVAEGKQNTKPPPQDKVSKYSTLERNEMPKISPKRYLNETSSLFVSNNRSRNSSMIQLSPEEYSLNSGTGNILLHQFDESSPQIKYFNLQNNIAVNQTKSRKELKFPSKKEAYKSDLAKQYHKPKSLNDIFKKVEKTNVQKTGMTKKSDRLSVSNNINQAKERCSDNLETLKKISFNGALYKNLPKIFVESENKTQLSKYDHHSKAQTSKPISLKEKKRAKSHDKVGLVEKNKIKENRAERKLNAIMDKNKLRAKSSESHLTSAEFPSTKTAPQNFKTNSSGKPRKSLSSSEVKLENKIKSATKKVANNKVSSVKQKITNKPENITNKADEDKSQKNYLYQRKTSAIFNQKLNIISPPNHSASTQFSSSNNPVNTCNMTSTNNFKDTGKALSLNQLQSTAEKQLVIRNKFLNVTGQTSNKNLAVNRVKPKVTEEIKDKVEIKVDNTLHKTKNKDNIGSDTLNVGYDSKVTPTFPELQTSKQKESEDQKKEEYNRKKEKVSGTTNSQQIAVVGASKFSLPKSLMAKKHCTVSTELHNEVNNTCSKDQKLDSEEFVKKTPNLNFSYPVSILAKTFKESKEVPSNNKNEKCKIDDCCVQKGNQSEPTVSVVKERSEPQMNCSIYSLNYKDKNTNTFLRPEDITLSNKYFTQKSTVTIENVKRKVNAVFQDKFEEKQKKFSVNPTDKTKVKGVNQVILPKNITNYNDKQVKVKSCKNILEKKNEETMKLLKTQNLEPHKLVSGEPKNSKQKETDLPGIKPRKTSNAIPSEKLQNLQSPLKQNKTKSIDRSNLSSIGDKGSNINLEEELRKITGSPFSSTGNSLITNGNRLETLHVESNALNKSKHVDSHNTATAILTKPSTMATDQSFFKVVSSEKSKNMETTKTTDTQMKIDQNLLVQREKYIAPLKQLEKHFDFEINKKSNTLHEGLLRSLKLIKSAEEISQKNHVNTPKRLSSFKSPPTNMARKNIKNTTSSTSSLKSFSLNPKEVKEMKSKVKMTNFSFKEFIREKTMKNEISDNKPPQSRLRVFKSVTQKEDPNLILNKSSLQVLPNSTNKFKTPENPQVLRSDLLETSARKDITCVKCSEPSKENNQLTTVKTVIPLNLEKSNTVKSFRPVRKPTLIKSQQQ